ncbi:trypsin-like peptidase domain-containing protein [Saccharophagus sp. K07]|uniref:trypsin-like peptidase domain-containing protein n=1 Tax=Saccharophagus sp. K07 TaxID=2283636 RepID=UPI0021064E17|nr:trypsin-like peptidase domain-containing protein [Saccharophagus sp. K07]
MALIILQLFPELNPRNSPTAPHNPSFNVMGQQYEGMTSYADAVNRAAPSVVNIFTRKKINRTTHRLFNDPLFRYFYNSADIPRQERMQSALGSGVIISEQGYLLTNNHVIYGADEIVVQLQDGRESKARVIGVDLENDLAVLKIELDNLKAIPIGSPQTAQVGDIVLAIGNPFGMGQTVTQGIISATGRYGLGISVFENFIQTDAAINPGNSGGALIDVHGNLLGINTAILDRIGNSDLNGVGLAVPADTAVRTLKDIVEFGRVVRGWLGVDAQSLTPQLAHSFQLDSTNGVLITRIYNKGPAHVAGLQPGDVIVKINDEPVGNGARGRQQIQESRPGETVDIEFYRNGKLERVQAILEKKPVTG